MRSDSVFLKSGAAKSGARSIFLTLIVRAAAWLLSAPLFLVRVKFLRLSAPGRIGHLASELDTYVKAGMLRLRWPCFGILIVPSGAAANECFLDYWRQYIRVVRSRFWTRVCWQLQAIPYLQLDLSNASINQTAAYIRVQKTWGMRAPLLRLTDTDRRRGRAALAQLGVPESAQFICFHAREPGYSPSDDAIHAYRNCNIESYMTAVHELARRGYWCIRMGDASVRPIGAGDRIIDYAHSEVRCDWMDVVLCAECKLFLGSSGGLLFLASVFGTPTATANHAPASSALAFGPLDIAIPKLVRSKKERRYLTFPEIFHSDIANFRFAKLYDEADIETVDNAAQDIRDLALEMLERTEGRASYGKEDEDLQQRFKSLLRPGHYGHGGINRIGRDFLRKYRSLLQHNAEQR
jgi:putative glycosyltransferase (TIGR04372 family)